MVAIAMVFTFSAIKFAYVWSTSPGPKYVDWEDAGVTRFWEEIDYDKSFRYEFIFLIIATFLLGLFLVVSGAPPVVESREDEQTLGSKIVVVEDDVLLVGPGERAEDVAASTRVLSLEEFFRRDATGFGRWLKVANVAAGLSVTVVASVFVLSTTIVPSFAYSDVGHVLFDASMTFLLVYFLARCPDMVRGLAQTGFRRAYLSKVHLHESFLGVLLALGGITLVINGAGEGAYFERMTGIVLLLLGAFLAGRDWKDLARGRFLH